VFEYPAKTFVAVMEGVNGIKGYVEYIQRSDG